MSRSVFDYIVRKCPVCGKEFLLPPENIYRLKVKRKYVDYCSYTCFRVIQKEQEQERRKKL